MKDSIVYRLLAKPMRFDELKRAIPEMSKQDLIAELEALGQAGLVLRNKKNRYAQAEHFGCTAATFLATERSFAFARPDTPRPEGDIFIPPGKDGGAWHGDRVLVQIVPSSARGHKSEGEVIRVLERSRAEITGEVQMKGKSYVLLPASARFPQIVLPKGKLNAAQVGDHVSVQVVFYGDGGLPPQGVVTAVHGIEGTMEAAVSGILRENGIYLDFSEESERQAAACGDTVDPAESAQRLDLRDKIIFTIDGDDAKDFDDAISLEPLENGRFELGVHIADVSHYVTPGSPLDDEAWRRGTSVYYPGHVVPMLPFALSHGICSLNPDVDRLTFSAFMELDKDGRRYGFRFAKSVIHSKARMTYNNVNKILDGDPALREQYSELVPTFERMAALSEATRKRRMERGALDLDIPEPQIIVDEKGMPIDVQYRDRGAAEKLIEEFMLLANESVAEFLKKRSAPSVFRIHEKPDPDKLRAFAMFARPFGYRVDPGKPQNTRQLQAVLNGAKGDPKQRALPTLLLRSLARARYDAECLGHYGLAAQYYLHFTSPIRRYPDLAAHRMLYKAISGQQFTKTDETFCEEAAGQSTAREFAADTAERDIDKLYLAAYMRQFIGEEFDAEVSSVAPFGLFVSLPNSVEGLVRIETLPGDYYEYIEEKMELRGQRSGFRYTIGTPLRVKLVGSNPVNGQIDFVPVDAAAEAER